MNLNDLRLYKRRFNMNLVSCQTNSNWSNESTFVSAKQSSTGKSCVGTYVGSTWDAA